MKNDIPKAIILMLSASCCFTIMNIAASQAGKSMPTGEVAFFRVFIAMLLLTPLMIKKSIPFIGQQWKLIMLRGIAGFASLSLGFYALTRIPLAEVSVLWKSSIIFTAILSAIILRETITTRLLIYFLLAILGTIMILKPSNGVLNSGGAAALTAGFLLSVVAVSIRTLHRYEESETIIFGFCFWGSLLGLILYGRDFTSPSAEQLRLLILIAVSGLAGQLMFTRAFKHGPASVVLPYLFSEVLFSALGGMILFSQFPDILSILGGTAIIMAGIGIASIERKNQQNLSIS